MKWSVKKPRGGRRERTTGEGANADAAGREDTKRLWNVECAVAAGGR